MSSKLLIFAFPLPYPVSVLFSPLHPSNRAPLYTNIFSRARFGEELFFFAASSAYLKGALTLLTFTLGSLLALDLALGDTNLVKVFTGRERRSLVIDKLSSISVSEVLLPSFNLLWRPIWFKLFLLQIMEKAAEVYAAIEKFENRDYTNLPR